MSWSRRSPTRQKESSSHVPSQRFVCAAWDSYIGTTHLLWYLRHFLASLLFFHLPLHRHSRIRKRERRWNPTPAGATASTKPMRPTVERNLWINTIKWSFNQRLQHKKLHLLTWIHRMVLQQEENLLMLAFLVLQQEEYTSSYLHQKKQIAPEQEIRRWD